MEKSILVRFPLLLFISFERVSASAMLTQQSARDRDKTREEKQRCQALAPPKSRSSVSVEPRRTCPLNL
ncbi:hypothetical protein QQF64_007410 [Cirrhinus molitorella]|uniref:Secreted protein n=1 Tax=Cirrhinus molitorella TaxID=172907 RepID=A0ABR3MAK9_9TELE